MAEALARAVGFRNVLVHEYLDVVGYRALAECEV